ncbi:TPA: HNH endonuclease, partial [Vibrio vulnificus]
DIQSHLFTSYLGKSMAFSKPIAEKLAYRSAYICNNPECNTLTVGAELDEASLKVKIGEAAHIIGEKPKSARYKKLPDGEAGSIENGIWLCANCHTMIDKNLGAGFPEDMIKGWKEKHEQMISMLVKTHKSPIPLLVKQTSNYKVAQSLVDFLSSKGVFYLDISYENPPHVFAALDETRKEVNRLARKIELDTDLKKVFTQIRNSAQEVMNETSSNNGHVDYQALDEHLKVMRRKIGRQLGVLKSKYGCDLSGPLSSIAP